MQTRSSEVIEDCINSTWCACLNLSHEISTPVVKGFGTERTQRRQLRGRCRADHANASILGKLDEQSPDSP